MTRHNSSVILDELDDYQIVPRMSTISISPTSSEKSLRLFKFKKNGQSWHTGTYSEIPAGENEIRKLAKAPKTEKKTVSYQWSKMSQPRREKLQGLLDDLEFESRIKWDIKSIINDRPDHTKRTGEVVEFSVVLEIPGTSTAESPAESKTKNTSTNRERTKSYHRDRSRRRSSVIIRDVSPKDREPSRPFNSSPQRMNSRTERRPTAYNDHRQNNKQTLPEDDPFGAKEMFSPDGLPIHTEGMMPYNFAGLPPDLSRSDPIGKLPEPLKDPKKDKEKDGKDKRSKSRGRRGKKDGGDDALDIEAIINGTAGDGIIEDPLGIGGGDHGLIDLGEVGLGDLPVEIDNDKYRRRKSGAGEDFMAHRSRRRSHSRPSIHHRRKSSFGQGQGPRMSGGILSGGRHGHSAASTGTPSIYSGDSILEGEIEEASSTDSSNAYDAYEYIHRRESKYRPASRQHRRGPPSPIREPENSGNPDRRRYSRGYERGGPEGALVTTTVASGRPGMHGRYHSMDQTMNSSAPAPSRPHYDERDRHYSYSTSRRDRPTVLQTTLPRSSAFDNTAMRSPNADLYPHEMSRDYGDYRERDFDRDRESAAERYMRNKGLEQDLVEREYEVQRRERILDDLERSVVAGSLMRRDSMNYGGGGQQQYAGPAPGYGGSYGGGNEQQQYAGPGPGTGYGSSYSGGGGGGGRMYDDRRGEPTYQRYGGGGGGGRERRNSVKYTHEPRASRRYSEANESGMGAPVQVDNGRYRN